MKEPFIPQSLINVHCKHEREMQEDEGDSEMLVPVNGNRISPGSGK